MILKVEVTYPSRAVHADRFPLDAATLFQACVQRYAGIAAARDAFLALEKSAVLRIDAAACVRTKTDIWVPRLSEKYLYDDPKARLPMDMTVFRFTDDCTPHLTHYLSGEFKSEWLPFYEPYRLGRGESLCVARASILEGDTLPARNKNSWEPAASGRRMRIPRAGLLDDLDLYYTHNKSIQEVTHKAMTFSTQPKRARVLMYKLDEPFHKWEQIKVAGMLRHAVIQAVPAALQTYAANHGADNDGRVMYIPLPTTVGKYPDNMIRRVMIVENSPRLPVHRVSELILIDQVSGKQVRAVRVTESDSVFDAYTAQSKKWSTVTPVLFSGHDDHDMRKRLKLVAKMFGHAGLPVPQRVTFDKMHDDGYKMKTKYGHDKWHRSMMTVEFDDEIDGVVAVGSGRFGGLGIFANVC